MIDFAPGFEHIREYNATRNHRGVPLMMQSNFAGEARFAITNTVTSPVPEENKGAKKIQPNPIEHLQEMHLAEWESGMPERGSD